MDREIKFRGRSLFSGHWVYGYFLKDLWNKQYILCLDETTQTTEQVEIDPETVGESVSLPDRNQKEIFEGDRIRFGWNPILHGESEIYEFEEVVFFDVEWSCFAIKITSRRGEEEKVSVGQLVSQETGKAEIVGNIHDEKLEARRGGA